MDKHERRHHWTVFAASVAMMVVGLLLWLAAGTLFMIFAAVLLAVFLCGLTDLLARYTGMRRLGALAIVCLILLLAIGVAAWFTASTLAEQVQQFSEELPEAVKDLRKKLEAYPWGAFVADELKQVRTSAEDSEKTLSRAAGAASAVVETVTGAVVIGFLGLFLAIDPELYKRSLVRLVPPDRRERAREVLDGASMALWRWILGRLVSMGAVAVGATLGFYLVGMPMALMLGVFAGLVNFIPNLGPLFWLAPAMLLAFVQSPVQALYVGLLFMVVQTLEGYVITPAVQQRMVHLPPAVALSVQVIFGALWGFPGLALATPFAALSLVVVRKLYVEDALGDSPDETE
ncbi:MAG TPA: AI-2E family transporter [Pirellulales bacterium]|nr:AI-2E family transporter [Pirellulales bacterium]